KKMRDLLGRFGLSGDVVHQNVGELSGGERSRACLAKLTALGVNVLVLDEPTNHLDIWACESLEEALRAYDGTVIVVSHDRYFLNRIADMLIVLDDGNARVVHGNYDTYEMMRTVWSANEKGTRSQGDTKTRRDSENGNPAAKPMRRKRQFPF